MNGLFCAYCGEQLDGDTGESDDDEGGDKEPGMPDPPSFALPTKPKPTGKVNANNGSPHVGWLGHYQI
jgi:hypothetical protein